MTGLNKSAEIVKLLIRKAIDTSSLVDFELFQDVNWKKVMRISATQDVFAIAFDGIEHLPMECRPDKNSLIRWFGQVCYQEKLFEYNWKVAKMISGLWGSKGIETVVLKGRSIAQFYPKPEHRYSCDLDVFIGNGWDKACKILEDKGVKLVHEVYKEVEFTLNNVYVECHRYITPYRGNKTLRRFEKFLKDSLAESPKQYFDNTVLLSPPLMFIIMLHIEHALGDLLHGKFSLKHVVDWMILRKQSIDVDSIELRCKEFGFDRFLKLIDALADVVEGKCEFTCLPSSFQEVYNSLFIIPSISKEPKSWFARRVSLFFEIIQNKRMYKNFGYCSMEWFLLNAVWCHFLKKEVNG